MGLIDYTSRHPVDKPQPPAYWDEHFVVALIDKFFSCLEFQDSTIANIEMIKNPNGVQRLTGAKTFLIQIRTQKQQNSLLIVNL